jgi:RHS repeat-associated protein
VYAGPGAPDFMLRAGVPFRIVKDHLGSVRLVINANTGAVAQRLSYDEFGRVLEDTVPGFQPFGFAGGLYDVDTKLVRFGARDYDPETGRFTAPDPLRFEGGGTNLYVYALNDPVNLVDPTGAFLDIIIDVISIGYDIYKIGSSLANGCGVSGTDAFALGADVIGAIVPFATGAGAAVRAGSPAARAEKKIVIGEDMAGRVIPEAKRLGADYYDPPKAPPEQWMENNRKWINDRMDEGCTIINCGPAPGRANYPNPTSPYYQMELDEIAKRGYPMSPPPK